MSAPVGRYELVRTIGRGGMAEVFLARRRGAAGIAKRLVVKRVRQDLTSDPRFAEMFLREARVATLLSHKNIVTVFDVGRDEDGLFLAMDYVDGPDLGAVLDRNRQGSRAMDPLLSAHIGSEVAAGLDYAHRLRDEAGVPLGLVHRDVTPRNILLSQGGEVKVTDFGIAVLEGDSGDERRGTVPYMSPEQARGEPVDPRSDLFSLGLVLYELLTGRRAYTGAKEELAEQVRTAALPPLGDGVPPQLAEVVARACCLAREDRYESARAMQRDLTAFAVAERARRDEVDAPEHALASFLAETMPDWSDRGEEVSAGVAGAAGTSTMRSVMETVGAEEAAPLASQPGQPSAGISVTTAAPARRRAAWPIAGAGLFVAVAGGIAIFAFARADAGSERARPSDEPSTARAADAVPRPDPVADLEPDSVPDSVPDSDPDPVPDPDPASPPRPAKDRRPSVATTADPPAAAKATGDPPAVPSSEPGLLDLNAVPWAFVSIDGGPEEETPIRARKLAPGAHQVRIRNPVLERERDMSIKIKSGETSRYVVDLRQ